MVTVIFCSDVGTRDLCVGTAGCSYFLSTRPKQIEIIEIRNQSKGSKKLEEIIKSCESIDACSAAGSALERWARGKIATMYFIILNPFVWCRAVFLFMLISVLSRRSIASELFRSWVALTGSGAYHDGPRQRFLGLQQRHITYWIFNSSLSFFYWSWIQGIVS